MEWAVVTTIIALVGLGAAVIKPIVSLAQTLTKLATIVDQLQKDMEGQKKDVHESFVKFQAKEEEQDEKLEDHETRLQLLEEK